MVSSVQCREEMDNIKKTSRSEQFAQFFAFFEYLTVQVVKIISIKKWALYEKTQKTFFVPNSMWCLPGGYRG